MATSFVKSNLHKYNSRQGLCKKSLIVSTVFATTFHLNHNADNLLAMIWTQCWASCKSTHWFEIVANLHPRRHCRGDDHGRTSPIKQHSFSLCNTPQNAIGTAGCLIYCNIHVRSAQTRPCCNTKLFSQSADGQCAWLRPRQQSTPIQGLQSVGLPFQPHPSMQWLACFDDRNKDMVMAVHWTHSHYRSSHK